MQQCGAAAAQVIAPLVNAGAQGKFTADEILHLKCAVGDPAACGAIGRDAAQTVRDRWVCTSAAAASEGQRYCDMVIPVSRLVAMPDALGVVFFDRDDVDNASYALQVGTAGLCATDKDDLPSTRPFAAVGFREP